MAHAAFPAQPLFWKDGKPLLQKERASTAVPRHSLLSSLAGAESERNQTKPSNTPNWDETVTMQAQGRQELQGTGLSNRLFLIWLLGSWTRLQLLCIAML